MKAYKTKWFQRWAVKERLCDEALMVTIKAMTKGLIDADLGGHVIKQRVALSGQGKRGSVRTLVAFSLDDKAFFIFGFAKNERANISQKELKALKLLAAELLSYSATTLLKATRAGELIEVVGNG